MGYGLDIKHIFLSFAQTLFSNNDFITWNLNPNLTDIIIGDENFIANPLIELHPTIIIRRSAIRWGMVSIDQRASLDLFTGAKGFSDLLYGALTYNVMAKKIQTAERLADYLFGALTGHRDQFKERSINKITGLTIGDPTLIKGPTEVELVNVPITVQFVYNKQLYTTPESVDLSVRSALLTGVTRENATLGSRPSGNFNNGYYVELIDYTVSGLEISFLTIPSGVELTFEYIGDLSSSAITETAEFADGNILTYILLESPRPWYETLSGIEVYNDLFPETFKDHIEDFADTLETVGIITDYWDPFV